MPYFNPHNYTSIAIKDFSMVSAIEFPVQLKGNASSFLGASTSNEFPAGLSVSAFSFLGASTSNEFPAGLSATDI
jgi:hypothetical protein